MIEIRDLVIPARDGFNLAATSFEPGEAADTRPAIIIAAAMGVKRGFYHKYAAYLAAQGSPVVTFDYRGIGGSRPATLNKFRARLRDWGESDIAGIIDWVTERGNVDKVALVGHSVGGQITGLAHNNDKISAMLLVASQSGYWRHWPLHTRYLICIFWYLALPAATFSFSYFPGWLFGMGENIPSGVALEWASWGRKPNYVLDQPALTAKKNFAKFSAAILSYSVPRDFVAPVRAVDALPRFYPNARASRRHLNPRDYAVRRIGHFDFFKSQFERTLWAESAAWLQQKTQPQAGDSN